MIGKFVAASVAALALMAIAGSAQALPSSSALTQAMPSTVAQSHVQEVRWWRGGHRRYHRGWGRRW